MAEEKKPKGRRAHLKDIVPTANGEYVYTGAHYALPDDRWKRTVALRWLMAAGCILCAVLGGVIPAPGMQNCFYVILPWAVSVLTAVSVVWAAARISYWGNPLREYVYEKTVLALPRRCVGHVIAVAAAGVGETVFLILNGSGEIHPICICLFYFLQIAGVALALLLRRAERAQEWQKQG